MDKLRVGILGLRRGLRHLINFLRVEKAEVIGCADLIVQRRERAAKHIAPEEVPMVERFEQLLAMSPDAVVIASNGRQQCEHSVTAMEAGCDVLSEIPGAWNKGEILDIVAAVRQTGRNYMFAENRCFADFLRHWRKWIIEGRLGPISLAEAEYLHYLPATLEDEAGNRYTPTEVREGNIGPVRPIWRADHEPILYLTHDLGPLLEVLDDRVVSVTCRSGPYHCAETPLRSDGQIGLFETAKGTLIRILVTLGTRQPSGHNYRIFGTEGSAMWYAHEGFCRLCDRHRSVHEGWQQVEIATARPEQEYVGGHGGADIQLAEFFTDAVLEGKSMPIDVYRMADYTLPGMIAAESARLGGQPISVPDIRTETYPGTNFWEHVGLPEEEPRICDYEAPGFD